MTVLTMRRVRDHFIVSGPDIEPMKFKSRPEARDWCKTHHPGSGNNETVAEDLLSDVFFDVWQQADRFEGRSAVSTWLLSIARFKALSARRRRTHAELDEVIEATVANSADNAEVVLEKKRQGEMLRDALTKLSPEHREIIDLVYYHEKSVDDAADILSIPRATVKTRMFYARKKLAELVQAA